MIYDSFKIFMGLPTTGEGLTIDIPLRMEPREANQEYRRGRSTTKQVDGLKDVLHETGKSCVERSCITWQKRNSLLSVCVCSVALF